MLPDFSLFGDIIGNAFAIAVVGYAITISLGKVFASKHGYKVDSNQVSQYCQFECIVSIIFYRAGS